MAAPGPGAFRGVDFALFSAGAERSRAWGPVAADEGAVVVDNSSAWRMDPQVPLVVPEVNLAAARERPRGIVANPNCSTIQMVVALQAVRKAAGLTRVIATTFQSVSGAGETGREALRREAAGEGLKLARLAQPVEGSPFARRIAENVIPQIGDFDEEGWSGEERKMIAETRKILDLPELPVAATCVRVPVDVGHAVQVTVETERELFGGRGAARAGALPGDPAPVRPGGVPHAAGGGGPRRGVRGAHPPGPVPAADAALLGGGGQPAQGRGHQRGADRGGARGWVGGAAAGPSAAGGRASRPAPAG